MEGVDAQSNTNENKNLCSSSEIFITKMLFTPHCIFTITIDIDNSMTSIKSFITPPVQVNVTIIVTSTAFI